MTVLFKFKAMPNTVVELTGGTVDEVLNSQDAMSSYQQIKESADISKELLAFPFVEVYVSGVYDDELSGTVTSKLHNTVYPLKRNPISDATWAATQALLAQSPEERKQYIKDAKKLARAEAVFAPKERDTKVPKPSITAKTPKLKVAGQVSTAEQVRELIRSNPSAQQGELVELAVTKLGMPLSRAVVYVRENLVRVRG